MTSESLKWAICLKCSAIFHNKYTWHSHLNMRLYNLPIIFSLTISKIPEHLIPRNKAHLCFSLKCCAFNPTVTRALILQDSHNQKFSWILQALPTQRKTNPKKKKKLYFQTDKSLLQWFLSEKSKWAVSRSTTTLQFWKAVSHQTSMCGIVNTYRQTDSPPWTSQSLNGCLSIPLDCEAASSSLTGVQQQ